MAYYNTYPYSYPPSAPSNAIATSGAGNSTIPSPVLPYDAPPNMPPYTNNHDPYRYYPPYSMHPPSETYPSAPHEHNYSDPYASPPVEPHYPTGPSLAPSIQYTGSYSQHSTTTSQSIDTSAASPNGTAAPTLISFSLNKPTPAAAPQSSSVYSDPRAAPYRVPTYPSTSLYTPPSAPTYHTPPVASAPSYNHPPSSSTSQQWPPDLVAYVSRSLTQCPVEYRDVSQTHMKSRLEALIAQNALTTVDWTNEPLAHIVYLQSLRSPHLPASATETNSFPPVGPKHAPSPKSHDFGNSSYKINSARLAMIESTNISAAPAATNDSPHNATRGTNSGNKNNKKRMNGKNQLQQPDEHSVGTSKQKKSKTTASRTPFVGEFDASPEQTAQRRARFDVDTSQPKSMTNFAPSKSVSSLDKSLYSVTGSSGDGNNDDFDFAWTPMQGTCENLEKQYLRLTLPPHSSSVRPQRILEKSLGMMKSKWTMEGKKEYKYLCDQLKSIRQDCTLQALHNDFVIDVYETHARIALQCLDLSEFIACLTQLKNLYAEVYHQVSKEEESQKQSDDSTKKQKKRQWSSYKASTNSSKTDDKKVDIESQYAYRPKIALRNEVEFSIYRLFYFVVMKNSMEINNSLRAIRSMKQHLIQQLDKITSNSSASNSSTSDFHVNQLSNEDATVYATITTSISYLNHALECHCAYNEDNFFAFFQLLPSAPFHSCLLLNTVVDSLRFRALIIMQRAYGKTSVSLLTIMKSLGFVSLQEAYDYVVAQNGKINQQENVNEGDGLVSARWLCSETVLEETKTVPVENDTSVTHALV